MDNYNDKVKQNATQNAFDSAIQTGEAALALTAGAALFYRANGAYLLSDGINRLYRFQAAANTISTNPLVTPIENYVNTVQKAWKQSAGSVPSDYTFDYTNSNPINSILKANDIVQNPSLLYEQYYNQHYLIDPIVKSNKLDNLPKDVRNTIIDLIPKIEQNSDSSAGIQDIKQMLVGPAKQYSYIIDDIANSINHAKNLLPFDEYKVTYVNKLSSYKTQVVSALLNPESLTDLSNKIQSSKTNILLGDRPATIKDILDKNNKSLFSDNVVLSKDGTSIEVTDVLSNFIKNNPNKGYEDLIVSPYLRVNKNGEILSFKGTAEYLHMGGDAAANTLPGRLLKIPDIMNTRNQPTLFMLHSGQIDPILANIMGSNSMELESDVVVANGRYYKVLEDGKLDSIKGTENLYSIPTNKGSVTYLTRDMYELNAKKSNPESNKLFDKLDLFQGEKAGFDFTERSYLSEYAGDNVAHFSTLDNSKIKSLANNDLKFIREEQNRALRLYRSINQHAYELPSSIYNKLATSKGTKEITDILNRSNNMQELFNNSYTDYDTRYYNTDLKKTIQSFHNDTVRFSQFNSVSKIDPLHAEKKGRVNYSGYKIARTELNKEIFLRLFDEHGKNENGYSYVSDLIEGLDLNTQERNQVKDLALHSYIQYRTGINSSFKTVENEKYVKESIESLYNLINVDNGTKDNERFQKDYIDFAKRNSNNKTRYSAIDEDMIPAREIPEYMTQRRIIKSPIEVATEINNGIKTTTTTSRLHNFVKQAVAGKGEEQYRTSLSSATYFFADRLNNTLNRFSVGTIFGFEYPEELPDIKLPLGLSHGTNSVLSTSKNLFLKRLLPLYLAYQGLDYISDLQKKETNMYTQESLLSGTANIDLLGRKIVDTLGLTNTFKNLKEASPILQYIGGDNLPYQSEEERRKYYQEGYTPIRNGRYWVWGSANELRGKNISYWLPNQLRSATADSYDVSMYGTFSNKWGHSWIPTPTNPLSPIAALLDPYWLEKLHYNDRPYPVTGPLFQEGTPWGTILNPTLGTLIKPVTYMHGDRLNKGVDTLAMSEVLNQYIKDKARNANNDNLFMLQNGKINPVAFTPYNAPTESQRIVSLQYNGLFQDDKIIIQNPKEYIGGIDLSDYETQDNNNKSTQSTISSPEDAPVAFQYGTPGNTRRIHLNNNITDLTLMEDLQIRAGVSGNSMSSSIVNALKSVFNLNNDIKNASMLDDGIHWNGSQGIYIPQKIRYSDNYAMNTVNNAEDINDALHSKQGMGFVHDASVSARLVGGIYGYMGSLLGDYGEMNRPHIANSQDMTGYTRRFWDMNLGGLGGDASEIFRRFIPSYGRYTAINPLMNNMPDWLPMRFRFGDPFCISPDTLIERNELDFIRADSINLNENILTHKGNSLPIKNIIKRKVLEDEKVYDFKIASISAVQSKFSEDHPLLVCRKQTSKIKRKTLIYERANIVLNALNNGITNKRKLASLINLDMKTVCNVFKLLYDNNLIEDYRNRKNSFHNITLKEYKLFDIQNIEHYFEWVKSKDIKIGDYVVYPIQNHKEKKIIIDLTEYIPEYLYSDKYIYVSGTLKNIDTIKSYEYLEKIKNIHYARGDLKKLLLKHNINRESFETAQALIKRDKKIERINRFIELTPELSYAIGLYLAEGYDEKSYISYCLHEKEEELFIRSMKGITDQIKCISYLWKKTPGTHGAQGYIYSKPIALFFHNFIGKYCDKKLVPNVYWNASNDCILRLLEGYFDGDGCHFITNNTSRISDKKYCCVSAVSVDKIMLLQLRKLLLRFNIVMSVNISIKSGHISHFKTYDSMSKETYCIKSIGCEAIKLIKLLWGKNIDLGYTRQSSHHYINDNYLYMRVEKIEEINNITEVYGFEIDKDNSFCTAGVATHNTSVPSGEERLPGRGYEALNQLHSDIYGKYGSMDRFKILADIAPYSPEFKFWKKIAAKQAQTDEQKEEFKAIRDRANSVSSHHDFFDYKFIGRGLNYQTATVSEVLGRGKFKIVGSDETYTMAGITVKNINNIGTDKVLSQYMHPGEEIRIGIDSNEVYQRVKDNTKSISAAVYIHDENINSQMVDDGYAKYKKSDTSSAATIGRYGTLTKLFGTASELIAHADIPLFHSQLMNVNSPLESYKNEHIYGTTYQTWSDFWGTTLEPNFEKAVSSPTIFMMAEGSRILYDYVKRNENKYSKFTGYATTGMYSLLNRGALAGSIIGRTIKLGSSGSTGVISRSRNIGANIGLALSLGTSIQFQNPTFMALSYARAGYVLGSKLEKLGIFKRNHVVGAALAIGTSLWLGAGNSGLHNDRGAWIPDRARNNWIMNDYFDRITYLKMMGLYRRAAEEAKSKENVDVDKFFKMEQRDRIAKQKLRSYLLKQKKSIQDDPSADSKDALTIINKKLSALSSTKTVLRGGEYTKSAVLYKQAADATMYGLRNDASMTDILRALPQDDRDYFMEFVQEKDPDRRKEILRYASPQLQRGLKQIWGLNYRLPKNNQWFFRHYGLPGSDWSGWRPNVNLNDIKAKTVKNEGLLFSDFGIYESAYRKPKVINAPVIKYKRGESSELSLQLKLKQILDGAGLDNVEVSVDPTPSLGVQIKANVINATSSFLPSSIENIFASL